MTIGFRCHKVFCTSGKSLVESFSFIDADQNSSHLVAHMQGALFTIHVLGFIVCARAFRGFPLRSQRCSALERRDTARKTANIFSIASHMHRVSKTKTPLEAKNLRLVQKTLERVELRSNSAGLMTSRELRPYEMLQSSSLTAVVQNTTQRLAGAVPSQT